MQKGCKFSYLLSLRQLRWELGYAHCFEDDDCHNISLGYIEFSVVWIHQSDSMGRRISTSRVWLHTVVFNAPKIVLLETAICRNPTHEIAPEMSMEKQFSIMRYVMMVIPLSTSRLLQNICRVREPYQVPPTLHWGKRPLAALQVSVV